MRWIVFTLWLLLTPIWISYSSSAGSGSKVAFIPPALVLIALVFNWLRRRLVLHFAGEFEPSRSIQWSTPGRLSLRAKGTFHPAWGFAPSNGILRMALVAAAAGVCAGAVVGQSTYKAAVSNRSATQPASQEKLPISEQPEAVKSQSFVEPKKAPVTESVNGFESARLSLALTRNGD